MILPSKEFLDVFKETNGALSVTESIAIMNIAAQAPRGIFLELGTHKGKSAMSAVFGLPKGDFGLVEPCFKDCEINPTDVVNVVSKFSKHKRAYFIIEDYSTNILPNQKEMAYVFVDSGSHQDGLPMQEVKLLEDKMVQGGIIAFHDWNSQFKEVKEASDYLVSTGKYEYISIGWNEIIEYVNENNLEEGNSSWHHTGLKNPCFVGAVKRK